jgi:hypothetical protein
VLQAGRPPDDASVLCYGTEDAQIERLDAGRRDPSLAQNPCWRAAGVWDGAATAKGGLSLTAQSTAVCWIQLEPRKFSCRSRGMEARCDITKAQGAS